MTININYTNEFKRNLRHLIKKYPHIRQDVEPVINALQTGELLGDKVQHIGYSVYKCRLKNSDRQKGKSAGYRIIYYLKTSTEIILITIYSKSEQADISANEIKSIIENNHE
jgi:mRNA-degrading endonuclease RelE of RelBE toxin-antitoxin system